MKLSKAQRIRCIREVIEQRKSITSIDLKNIFEKSYDTINMDMKHLINKFPEKYILSKKTENRISFLVISKI